MFGSLSPVHDEELYHPPIVVVEGRNKQRVHVGGLLLFAKSKEQVLLDDVPFEWREDGSQVVWHQSALVELSFRAAAHSWSNN